MQQGDRVEYIGETLDIGDPGLGNPDLMKGELGWVTAIEPSGGVIVAWDRAGTCEVAAGSLRGVSETG